MAWNDGDYGPSAARFGQNDYLSQLRAMMMADALAGGRGARAAGMRSAGDDPSVAASYGMEGMLRGQSAASRAVSQGRLQWMQQQQALRNQMRLMKYQQKMQQGNPFLGALGTLGGAALGSWLPGIGTGLGASLGGGLGTLYTGENWG